MMLTGMALLVALLLLLFFMVAVRGMAASQAKGRDSERSRISDAGVRDLIGRGEFDQAVDVYRQFTGTDVYTAREVVNQLRREIQMGDAAEEIRRLLRLGDKAEAIETYQRLTGADLAEALEAIEQIQRQRR